MDSNQKYCKYCGELIDLDCIICPKCGKQVEEIKVNSEKIIVNNNLSATERIGAGREKNKWISFLLCLFLGGIGAHKFYEGKIGMGVLYLFTCGLFGIGWLIDTILLLLKPNPYYV